MKNLKKLLLTTSLIIATSINAQDAPKNKHYGFNGGFKVGMGTLENNQIGNLNGTVYMLEAKVFYSAFDNTKIGIGAGYLQFQSNFYDGNLNNNLTNTYLNIPLTINHRLSLHKANSTNSNLFFVVGAGMYLNYLFNTKISNLTTTLNNSNQGWNSGISAEIGFEYIFTDQVHFGLYAQNMNDLKSVDKNGLKQKLMDTNLIKFGVGVSF